MVRTTRCLGLLSAIALVGGLTMPATAVDPAATFDFENDLHGFGGGSQSYTNPSTGGVGNSGWLAVANTTATQLGARSFDIDIVGDYVAAGIQGVRVHLNDVGTDDALEVHLALGVAFNNVWQSNAGFAPPNGSWQEVVFDLTDSSQWTQIQGSGTFADALANANRFVLRHDVAPYTEIPDFIAADVGIDKISFDVLETVPGTSATWSLLLALGLMLGGAWLLRRRKLRPSS